MDAHLSISLSTVQQGFLSRLENALHLIIRPHSVLIDNDFLLGRMVNLPHETNEKWYLWFCLVKSCHVGLCRAVLRCEFYFSVSAGRLGSRKIQNGGHTALALVVGGCPQGEN